jgi:Leucine-rich repeat (LRR) protein
LLFLQKELFKELQRLTNLDLSNNQILDIEDTAFVSLRNLKIVILDMNLVEDLFKNHTFTGLDNLKRMTISSRVRYSLEVVKSIQSQIELRLVREVLYISLTN